MLKKSSVILDTNIIIRFLVRDHEAQYKQAAEIFKNIENDQISALFLDFVFTESVFVLEKIYNVERNIIAESLERILKLKGIRPTNIPLFLSALEFYQNRKIDIVDCLLLAYSNQNNLNILSFDKDINRVKK